MKFIFVLLSAILLNAQENCNRKEESASCFKGKLEIKAACMNYTISVQEGNMNDSLLVAKWTDEHSGKNYENVFALDSRCNFPDSLNEGDEFYFTIDSTSNTQNCAVCLIYYPVPQKRLAIKVLPSCPEQ